MMALTIGTNGHHCTCYFLQQSTSHFMIFSEGLVGLQFFGPWLYPDEVAHLLAKNLTVLPELSDFTSSVAQRSWPSVQETSIAVGLILRFIKIKYKSPTNISEYHIRSQYQNTRFVRLTIGVSVKLLQIQ